MWESTDTENGQMKWMPHIAPVTPGSIALSSEPTHPVGSLPVDFVPIHVSLACVLVIALLVGWDTRRKKGLAWGTGGRAEARM